MKNQIKQQLNELQIAMRLHQVWEEIAPAAERLASEQPFCFDTLSPTQWLQWVFIPRFYALLEADAELPHNFAVTPYLEESLKNTDYLPALHSPLLKLEQLLRK